MSVATLPLMAISRKRLRRKTTVDMSSQLQHPATMSAAALLLMQISGKRLRRKTRKDELVFPVMSNESHITHSAWFIQSCTDFVEYTRVVSSAIQTQNIIPLSSPPAARENVRRRSPHGYRRRKLKSKCLQLPIWIC